MVPEHLPAALVSGILMAATISAQPSPAPSHLSVSLHAQVLSQTFVDADVAADRSGQVYVLLRSGFNAVSDAIVRVDGGGGVHTGFVGGIGKLSQLAYNPADGFCYVAAHDPALTVVHATIHRIDPASGAVPVGGVNLIPEGFTIDDAGRMYFGTDGGLYTHDPAGPAGNLTFLDAGHELNRHLLALVSGDVLIAGWLDVRRWSPGTPGTAPYFTVPTVPDGPSRIQALARQPFNQLAPGALIGVRDVSTACLCGASRTFVADLTGQQAALFASEPFTNYPFQGLRTLAAGPAHDLWWFTSHPPGGGLPLYRIQESPAHGSPGSLLAAVAPGSVTLDLYGPSGGGDPFVLGAVPTPAPAGTSTFLPPFGVLELDPFHPLYTPVFDGVGLFGAPQPEAQIPSGGHFQLSGDPGPGVTGLAFDLQALILAPGLSPNGLFLPSNVASVVLP